MARLKFSAAICRWMGGWTLEYLDSLPAQDVLILGDDMIAQLNASVPRGRRK